MLFPFTLVRGRGTVAHIRRRERGGLCSSSVLESRAQRNPRTIFHNGESEMRTTKATDDSTTRAAGSSLGHATLQHYSGLPLGRQSDVSMDSRTVQQLIRSTNRRYRPFAAHRVSEILETTRATWWKWLPTATRNREATIRPRQPLGTGSGVPACGRDQMAIETHQLSRIQKLSSHNFWALLQFRITY